MEYRVKNGICYVSLGGSFPEGARPVRKPVPPLVILVRRDPLRSCGFRAISRLGELTEDEGPVQLLPARTPADAPEELESFVRTHGASVLNTAFPGCFAFAEHWFAPRKKPWKVTLVGLGDVGGTVLTALKLLGGCLSEIAIFDMNEAQCKRYEMELNQVLSTADNPLPRVTICREEQMFDCDLFLFTASRGVPAVGAQVADVRMAQYEANRAMLATYARRARAARFKGLFCQISDPVDLLARSVFLESNRGEAGHYDWQGLLPEQVQGFGLGVMAARAAYYAPTLGLEPEAVTVFGPHGQGLVAANRVDEGYDPALSEELSRLTREANLRVRDLGFKPYIAPGISSAALSILQLLQGDFHHGAVPLGSAYFGCRSRFTAQGLQLQRQPICEELLQRLQQAYDELVTD